MQLLITNKITACTLRVLSGFYHIAPFGKACVRARAQGTSGFCKDDLKGIAAHPSIILSHNQACPVA